MAASENFPAVFERLKLILESYAANMLVTADGPRGYSLDSHPTAKYPKGMFFGSATIKKNYVSFYLMPIYMFPDLLKGLPECLSKRKQGKSCFNFTKIDEQAFDELARLTQKGFERGKRELSA